MTLKRLCRTSGSRSWARRPYGWNDEDEGNVVREDVNWTGKSLKRDGRCHNISGTTQNRIHMETTKFQWPALIMAAVQGSVVNIFDSFREELDDYGDRRERLIKVFLPFILHSAACLSDNFTLIGKSRCNKPIQENYISTSSYHDRGHRRYRSHSISTCSSSRSR